MRPHKTDRIIQINTALLALSLFLVILGSIGCGSGRVTHPDASSSDDGSTDALLDSNTTNFCANFSTNDLCNAEESCSWCDYTNTCTPTGQCSNCAAKSTESDCTTAANNSCKWCTTAQRCVDEFQACDCSMFVTSTTYDVNNPNDAIASFVGLAGADARCQEHAASASRAGTWKAIISTSQIDAKNRFSATQMGKVFNVQNELLAHDYDDLWDGEILTPVLYDENNLAKTGGGAWTGSTSLGEKSAGNMCGDWVSYGGPVVIGHVGTTASWLVYSGSFQCTGGRGLYCMSCN
ncbi:MAG: hypothetical protein IPJ88_05320 [Myxococcales bacterium]|nr:MAG: hypothetical protein IPJ88_05320 [Myxococcales bacterium]